MNMRKAMNKKPLAIDLFCGAGGLSLGLKRAGFKVLAAVDSDKNACLTFKRNHKDTKVICADISKLKVNDFLNKIRISKDEVELIAGGPPCQGFSMANGRNRGRNNPKNKMIDHFVRFVRKIEPQLFLMENVLGFRSMEKGRMVENLQRRFSRLGYKTKLITLNAVDYGVPQSRTRIFLIGTKNNKEFKEPKSKHICKKDYVTVKSAILGDLPSIDCAPGMNIWKYSRCPRTKYQAKMRKNVDKLFNHIITKSSKTVRKRQSLVPAGSNWRAVPKKFCNIKVQFSSTYKRLDPEKPSITVGNFRKSMLIHPFENRGLSVREAARLQSFPDSYIFEGGISSMQQQVGDAVPPLLAEAIAKKLISLTEEDFIKKLLSWGQKNQRVFPWRKTKNAFHILIAEMMLQKTDTEKVMEIYPNFIKKYKTPSLLARANLKKLKEELHSLGLHSRAKRMKMTATKIVTQFKGKVPKNKKDLLSLPGIGPYVANAVLCFAFNQDVGLVDTNVIKVLQMFLNIKSNKKRPRNDRALWDRVQKMIPPNKGKLFNKSLIDLSAYIRKKKRIPKVFIS